MPRTKQPGKPTPKQIKIALTNRAAGVPQALCAEAIGVSPRTLQRWIKKGNAGDCEACAALAEGWRDVESDRIQNLLKHILRSAEQGTWQAAAWLLERTRPRDFCKPEVRLKLEQEHDVDENNPLDGWEEMSPDERRDAIRKLHGWG